MESLYTTYRPRTFTEVVGQQHVVATLTHAVTHNKIAHAYLFCGPRGTGKTTMARLLAKALTCTHTTNHLPCGACDACLQIARAQHPDVLELDAASRTGVDNVREEILNRVSYAPVVAPYKIFIIDEVHMLTTAAFNALLKTIEEPPAHVIFIMCTTEPQKIPETILSRVQRFDFHSVAANDMFEHLKHVCASEHIQATDDAIWAIVHHAQGGMRDALSSLEQVSVFGSGSIDAALVRTMFGETQDDALARLTCALLDARMADVFRCVCNFADTGEDLLRCARDLAAFLRDVYAWYLYATAAGGAGAAAATDAPLAGGLISSSRSADMLRDCSSHITSEEQALSLLSHLTDLILALKTADNRRLLFELFCCKMALEHKATLPGARPVASASAPAAAPRPARAPATRPVVAHAAAPAPAPAPAVSALPSRPAAQPAPAAPAMPTQPAPAAAPRPVAQSAPAAASQQSPQQRWEHILASMQQQNPATGALLLQSQLVSDDADTLVVKLPVGSAFTIKMLSDPATQAQLYAWTTPVFGKKRISFVESSAPAPVSKAAAAPQVAAVSPTPAPGSKPTPAPQPAPIPQPQPAPQPKPQPTPQPVQTSSMRASQAPTPAQQATKLQVEATAPTSATQTPQVQVSGVRAPSKKEEAILAMLTEVFGDNVRATITPAENGKQPAQTQQ
ncbi:DNA polymerase III, subunit gamma and tau [Fannyhessea vaginae PB189-T1-4]|uniref:DNA polymerase III subunit gamma/tau n=1 Tax=Fannyhessea vaginae PB189-T1-4 TaxID=866774 RepID=A0ABN0B0T8_9ACTN|nr:DNA polymerase III subunit gamma/tau [Fannyhessea vaginae]EFL44383.1 DNA polymerase III, subunit gamma and tau [Fannyhessea vaginae PB189-T1-4]